MSVSIVIIAIKLNTIKCINFSVVIVIKWFYSTGVLNFWGESWQRPAEVWGLIEWLWRQAGSSSLQLLLPVEDRPVWKKRGGIFAGLAGVEISDLVFWGVHAFWHNRVPILEFIEPFVSVLLWCTGVFKVYLNYDRLRCLLNGFIRVDARPWCPWNVLEFYFLSLNLFVSLKSPWSLDSSNIVLEMSLNYTWYIET